MYRKAAPAQRFVSRCVPYRGFMTGAEAAGFAQGLGQTLMFAKSSDYPRKTLPVLMLKVSIEDHAHRTHQQASSRQHANAVCIQLD